MSSFRRLVPVLALTLFAAHVSFAQDSSSSAPQSQDQAQPTAPNQGSLSVQARIRARREQRRAQAIRDVYSHLYEVSTGMSYLRFTPGPNLQRVTLYAWDASVTRFYSERLGATIDGRGYYGTPFVGLNYSSVTKPAISVYTVMGGPTYRFLLEPRYSVSGRVMAGYAQGNFSGDTNGFSPTSLGLYSDGGTFAANANIAAEYNVSPGLGLRLGGDYVATGFGSSVQNGFGFTGGFVFRFGKQ